MCLSLQFEGLGTSCQIASHGRECTVERRKRYLVVGTRTTCTPYDLAEFEWCRATQRCGRRARNVTRRRRIADDCADNESAPDTLVEP